MTDMIFNHIDSNHNGGVSKDELWVALRELAKSKNHTITEADKKYVNALVAKDISKNGNDKSFDHYEFNLFANTFAKHYGLCPKIPEHA